MNNIRKMLTASGGPIHYSRTMTTDNLSKAANYVGNYILKGLGAFGKIMAAPLTGGPLGPATVVLPKTKKLLDAERKITEIQELLIGKASTWLSPLNYGAALVTGNGLNARKGEEEVASWSPAALALGRIIELYAGPKGARGAIKGTKAGVEAAVNVAAKAGSKSAKKAVIARELRKNINQTKLAREEGTPITRTRIGDVEINDPQLFYRQGPVEMGEDFIKTGVVNPGTEYVNPMFARGKLFYGLGDAQKTTYTPPAKGEGIRFLLAKPRVDKPKPDLIVTKAEMSPANAKSKPIKEIIERDNFHPFSEKDYKTYTGMEDFMDLYNNAYYNGEFPDYKQVRRVTHELTRVVPKELLDASNATLYRYKQGYGYKKVESEPRTSLAFFERKPAKNNIVGASYDYRMEDPKGSMDFLKQFFALLKINGKEYTLEGLRDAANVQQGLPEHIQSYLNLNTVERAVRAMRKNGYSEREIQLYVDKVNEEMNKVKVGIYSDLEYNAAGALDFGGFYNSDTNFISINKDALLTKPAFTPNYIMKHEGRHLIDYNTSMTDDVINILEKAYDNDFLEIPKHEDAGNLKDYLHMDRERVTTNRDAREVLLSNLEKHPGEFLNLTKFAQTSFGKYKDMVDFLNELILYADPEDIINAVENSNGYGKRYINYLKKNNKLTSTKIEQLRLAMIHVPSYLLPVAGGYTLYNLFNQPLQQLQYLKQGGKMNILLKFKNGLK